MSCPAMAEVARPVPVHMKKYMLISMLSGPEIKYW